MTDLLLASFVHVTQYEIRYSQQGNQRITVSNSYGTLMPFPRNTVQLLNTSYITQLFFNSNIDVQLDLM